MGSNAAWLKGLTAILIIALAGAILSGIGYVTTVAKVSHLAWCSMIEGGSSTYMYGTNCPTAYVTPDDVYKAQSALPGLQLSFWICVIFALASIALLVFITTSWLKEEYGGVFRGIQQRSFDRKFVNLMMHSNLTEAEAAMFSDDTSN